jgi:hypothetical protein
MKKKHSLNIYKINITSLMTLPFANDGIHTGFPLLVQDMWKWLSITRRLSTIPHQRLIVVC